MTGGLSLIDPVLLGKALGDKTWWRWLENLHMPWGKLWRVKYVPNHSSRDLMRLTRNINGSTIWNQAWKNKKNI